MRALHLDGPPPRGDPDASRGQADDFTRGDSGPGLDQCRPGPWQRLHSIPPLTGTVDGTASSGPNSALEDENRPLPRPFASPVPFLESGRKDLRCPLVWPLVTLCFPRLDPESRVLPTAR